jgi:hypothetical protein
LETTGYTGTALQPVMNDNVIIIIINFFMVILLCDMGGSCDSQLSSLVLLLYQASVLESFLPQFAVWQYPFESNSVLAHIVLKKIQS